MTDGEYADNDTNITTSSPISAVSMYMINWGIINHSKTSIHAKDQQCMLGGDH